MKECPKCGELVGDHVERCFSCGCDFNALKKEQLQREAERDEQSFLINDLYEYDVVSIVDDSTGCLDIALLKRTLEEHGKKGWRLVNSFANEVGRISSVHGMGGISTETNATVDQIILIFERCVKRNETHNIFSRG